jgi:hypothetical protein
VVKCSEVLQYSVGLRNKVSNIIRRHKDNMGLLLIYNLLLSHSFIFLMYIWLCSCLTNVFLFLYLTVRSIVYLCIYSMFTYSLYVYVSLRLP